MSVTEEEEEMTALAEHEGDTRHVTSESTERDRPNSSERPTLPHFLLTSTLAPQTVNRRKFSFPAALHSNLLGLTAVGERNAAAKRRFSNVGDVVSRKLSSTIGWRVGGGGSVLGPDVAGIGAGAIGDVVGEGCALLCRYVRSRLRRTVSGGNGGGGSVAWSRRVAVLRLRAAAGAAATSRQLAVAVDVCPSMGAACAELERSHPRLFANVARRAAVAAVAPHGATVGGARSSGGGGRATVVVGGARLSTPAAAVAPKAADEALAALLVAVGREVLRPGEITWGRVCAMYALAGALAADLVCLGRPEHMQVVVDAVRDLLEEDAAEWIAANGGWHALTLHCRSPKPDVSVYKYLLLFSLLLTLLLLLYILLKLCQKICFY